MAVHPIFLRAGNPYLYQRVYAADLDPTATAAHPQIGQVDERVAEGLETFHSLSERPRAQDCDEVDLAALQEAVSALCAVLAEAGDENGEGDESGEEGSDEEETAAPRGRVVKGKTKLVNNLFARKLGKVAEDWETSQEAEDLVAAYAKVCRGVELEPRLALHDAEALLDEWQGGDAVEKQLLLEIAAAYEQLATLAAAKLVAKE